MSMSWNYFLESISENRHKLEELEAQILEKLEEATMAKRAKPRWYVQKLENKLDETQRALASAIALDEFDGWYEHLGNG
jgi:NurA-like 5'-3' nuclease